MTFGNTSSARRSGLGFGSTSRGMAQPARPAAPAPVERGGRGTGERKSSWTSIASLYDPYHSAMEPQVVADFYRTSLAIKLSPVFADRRGPDEGQAGAGKKYDHENQFIIVLDLQQIVVFKYQLEAFLMGALSEFVIERGDGSKRLVLCPATALYDATHPEYSLHANGMALIIEQDPDGKTNGGNCVFVSRQQAVVLADGAEPVAFYPELQALLAIVESIVSNCARVDFASTRLLNFGGAAEERPAGPIATQPVRRSGGLAAPTARPAPTATMDPADNPEAGTAPAPARTAPVMQSGAVSDMDLNAALGGDTPQF